MTDSNGYVILKRILLRKYAKGMEPPMNLDEITDLSLNNASYKTTVIDGQIGVKTITKEAEQAGKSSWWNGPENRQRTEERRVDRPDFVALKVFKILVGRYRETCFFIIFFWK